MKQISRMIYNIRPFTLGLVLGVAVMVTANSLGHVVLVQVVPDSLTLTQEVMR